MTKINFPELIKTLSGHAVIQFDKNEKKDQELLNILEITSKLSIKLMKEKPIIRERANEAGNDAEAYVEDAIEQCGLKNIPFAKKVGYPDIHFMDKSNRHNYLEIKTYNFMQEGKNSMRTFYLSPAKNFKIQYDGHHFLIAFAMKSEPENGLLKFEPQKFKIITLDKLVCKLKSEYNAGNQDLYNKDTMLRDGS